MTYTIKIVDPIDNTQFCHTYTSDVWPEPGDSVPYGKEAPAKVKSVSSGEGGSQAIVRIIATATRVGRFRPPQGLI
ncbi:MAG: hypothetical protein JSS65_09320 [Armatimonadetes bacterium]|nr:hypothetical protein [Armatimonadota bacterium]